MTREELQAIEERAAKATKGPWGYDLNHSVAVLGADEEWGDTIVQAPWGMRGSPVPPKVQRNLAFIAHARTDVPKLAAALTEAGKEQTAITDVLREEIRKRADLQAQLAKARTLLGDMERQARQGAEHAEQNGDGERTQLTLLSLADWARTTLAAIDAGEKPHA